MLKVAVVHGREILMLKVAVVHGREILMLKVAVVHGREIVRFLPYHCLIHTMAMVWDQVKGHIQRRNSCYTLSALRNLLNEGRPRVMQTRIKHSIRRVIC
jgi:hypothetical protein